MCLYLSSVYTLATSAWPSWLVLPQSVMRFQLIWIQNVMAGNSQIHFGFFSLLPLFQFSTSFPCKFLPFLTVSYIHIWEISVFFSRSSLYTVLYERRLVLVGLSVINAPCQ